MDITYIIEKVFKVTSYPAMAIYRIRRNFKDKDIK